MNILKLIAQLSLDGKGFKAGLREAESFANQSVKRIGSFAAGAFGVGAMTAFVRETIQATTQLKDFSEQFGVTTDEVQQLKKAAEEAGGIGFEALGQAMVKLANARQGASTSNDKMLATFNKYGITLAQLQDPQLRNIDLLKKLAAAMGNLSETDRADLSDLFGKSGQRIVETLKAINQQGPIEITSQKDIDRLDAAVERLAEIKRLAQVKTAGGLADALNVTANSLEGGRGPSAYRDVLEGKGSFAGVLAQVIADSIQPITAIKRELGLNQEKGFRPTLGDLRAREVTNTDTNTPGLNEITPATQERIEKMRIESEKKVAEAALKFRLSTMGTESTKRKELESQLADKIRSERRKRAVAEELLPEARAKMLGAADEDRIAALGLMSQIQSLKSNPLTDSVAANSQFAGRNLVVDQKESEVVKVAKQQLGIAQETATAVKSLDTKIIGMTTILGAE